MSRAVSKSAVRVTLRDVAASAGVSLTAASFALNDSGSISAATRAKVLAAVKRLGYRVDERVSEFMRRVRQNRHASYRETIAVLDTWPTRGGWHGPLVNQYYRSGIRTRAAELGYSLEEHWAGKPDMTPQRMADILQARGIRGVIVPPVVRPDASGLLDWEAFAAVTIGPSLTVPISRICNHRFRTVRTAIDRLKQLGYHRLGFVMLRHPLPIVEDFWCSGFATYQAKVSPRNRVPILIYEVNDVRSIGPWYRKYRPEAVLIHEMDQAEVLCSAGMVPGKTGAIAHLNWEPGVAEFAGVDQRGELMGASAIDCLMGKLIRNEIGLPEAPQEIMIESVWRDGPSAPQLP